MTWDPSKPADTTKLRVAPGLERSNWNAIQQGGVPYVKIQLAEQGANPTRADNTGWIYTKESSSQTELYYEDDRNPAKVIQLTNNGAIGNSGVDIFANRITFNNGTTYLDKNKQVTGWLKVSANGAASGTSGDMTVVRTSAGKYTVTFNTVTISAYVAHVQISSATGSSSLARRSSTITNRIAASFLITIYSNSTGDPEDEDFMVTVFGGR